tara:strand:+ start:66 stop:320 length:255 start_codon:yes stop_codon:yes gene_type:complete
VYVILTTLPQSVIAENNISDGKSKTINIKKRFLQTIQLNIFDLKEINLIFVLKIKTNKGEKDTSISIKYLKITSKEKRIKTASN